MIVEWLMQLSAGFLEWVATLFPPVDLPEWVDNPFFGLQWVIESAAGWGVWVNVGFLVVVTGVVGAVYIVGVSIRLVRAVIAHVPMIGGGG